MLVTFVWLTTIPVFGQQPCTNFGAGGLAFPPLTNTTYFTTLAVQADGKIVAAGYYRDSKGTDMLVARFTPEGKPDPTFGKFGMATFDVTDMSKDDVAYCIAFTSDGRILIGGESNGYGAIIKISTNGNLYTGFSGDGILLYTYLYSTVDAIKVSGTDFLAIGRTYNVNSLVLRNLSVYAFTAAGAPLTTYGENGVYLNDDFVVDRYHPFTAALQGDNKLVVGASTFLSDAADNVTLVRVNTNGTTDNTFGTNGMIKETATKDTWVNDVHTSGVSVYAGFTKGVGTPSSQLAEVMKLNANGTLATDFNVSGRSVHTVAGTGARLKGMVVNSAGVVTFAGSKKSGSNYHYLLASYTAAGNPDAAFGSKVFTLPGFPSGELNDMVGLSDGSFVACGFAANAEDTLGTVFKFNSNGNLAATFNGTGYQFAYHVPSSQAYGVNVQSDGKILVGGYSDIGGDLAATLVRFLPNGQPDVTFGKRGVVTTNLVSNGNDIYRAQFGLPSGGVIAAASGAADFVVTKFLANGILDNNFGTGGIAKCRPGTAAVDDVNDMMIDAQGNILVSGSANYTPPYSDGCVMRLLPTGAPDPSFGTSGAVQFAFSSRDDRILSLAPGPDNTIYAAGSGHQGTQRTGIVARLLANGSLDPAFGTNGTVVLSGAPALEIIARKVLALDGGKIIVAYYEAAYGTANDDKVFLCRYMPDGTPDPSFGNNGKTYITITGGKDVELRGMVIDNAGRIYMSGNFVKGSVNNLFLTRLLSNGSTDATYGVNGHYETDDYRSFYADHGLALNITSGNLYATSYPVNLPNTMGVMCIGTGEANDCDAMPSPVITRNAAELVSTVGDAYTWYLNGNDLNVHTQSITPVNEGNYTVEVTTGTCTKISSPFLFTVTGVEDRELLARVYPNPVEDNLFIQTLRASGKLSVYSSQGLLLMQTSLSTEEHKISLKNLPQGLYILVLQTGGENQLFRIVKGTR
jgi:uncharacterized delta-60 repeat protein